jgi:hypothetical protein
MASASGPLVQLCRSLTPTVFATLRRRGHVVVDGAVDAHWKAALRNDIDRLNATGRLHLNSTHLVTSGSTQYLEKSNVWEAEGADPAVLADCNALAAFENDLAFVHRLNELGMASCGGGRHRLVRQTTKVQFNAGGGGCFPYHFDTDPALDTRRLTAILYLNDDEWDSRRDGGQLLLAPWPRRSIEIEPRGDRLAIFASADMAHRVMPSRAPRYCLTMWLWAANDVDAVTVSANNSSSSSSRGGSRERSSATSEPHRRTPRWRGAELTPDGVSQLAAFADDSFRQRQRTDNSPPVQEVAPAAAIAAFRCILAPQYRRHTVRWALAQEWANSIRESHPAGPCVPRMWARAIPWVIPLWTSAHRHPPPVCPCAPAPPHPLVCGHRQFACVQMRARALTTFLCSARSR